MSRRLTVDQHVEGVLAGDRAVVARTITLVESTAARHRAKAEQVLVRLHPHTGRAHRVGVSGVPGVGKSTFVETLGLRLLDAGHRLAVLAIDPSSAVSGGSILGDKTRMERLATDTRAFIRPSPTAGDLGGVHRATRRAMLVCEAAGFDVVMIETVGVGQSEVSVASLTDTVLLLMLAGAGDELQGIKRGILEVADVVSVQKADGDNLERAKRARAELAAALRLLRGKGAPPVLTCSALTGDRIDDVWQAVRDHREAGLADGRFEARRREQRRAALWATVEQELQLRFERSAVVAANRQALEADVLDGRATPEGAASTLLSAFWEAP